MYYTRLLWLQNIKIVTNIFLYIINWKVRNYYDVYMKLFELGFDKTTKTTKTTINLPEFKCVIALKF